MITFDDDKIIALGKSGWMVGDTQEFLGLTDDEMLLIGGAIDE